MTDSKFAEVHGQAEKNGIEFIDLKMLDLGGRLHHISYPFDRFTEATCREGIGFDGSSYGFLKVENSDMVLVPDLDTAAVDPFRRRPTLTMFAEACLTDSQRSPFPQDSRYVARRAEQAMRDAGVADLSQWAPEYEFHIFEEANFQTEENDSAFGVRSGETFFQNESYIVRNCPTTSECSEATLFR